MSILSKRGESVSPSRWRVQVASKAPMPTLAPVPTPTVTSVVVLPCGSTSCGGITTIKVAGTGFTANTRVELVGSGINGSYVGGDGSTKILTDFINVPAGTYTVRAYSKTGDTQEVIKPSAVTL